ncbi:hypothetical protein GCK32_012026, partial [Trichostrongylus colubriformis]
SQRHIFCLYHTISLLRFISCFASSVGLHLMVTQIIQEWHYSESDFNEMLRTINIRKNSAIKQPEVHDNKN